MSIIDASLCLLPGQNRNIWLTNKQTNISYAQQYRTWSRDPGNCNCKSNTTKCVDFLKLSQANYNKLVLQNKIPSSIQNVSGLTTKKNLYNYYAKGNKNSLSHPHTFASQNTRGYTNPNNLKLPVNGFINTISSGIFISPSTKAFTGIYSRQNLICN